MKLLSKNRYYWANIYIITFSLYRSNVNTVHSLQSLSVLDKGVSKIINGIKKIAIILRLYYLGNIL